MLLSRSRHLDPAKKKNVNPVYVQLINLMNDLRMVVLPSFL